MKKSLLGVVCLCILFLTYAGFCKQETDKASKIPRSNGLGIAIPGSDKPSETFVIHAPGRYYLAGTRLCKGIGIDINAHNVTIDLMGYSLIGPGKDSGLNYGIRTNKYQNLEVRNGTIRDFGDRGIVDRGIDQPTGYKRIINVSLLNNGSCGICIGGPANLVKECICANNGASGMCPGYRSRIVGNLCYDNEHNGILAGRGCTITDNNTSENGQSGIISYCGSLVSHNCVYMNNHSKDQNHAGIIVMDGCFIQDNVLRENHINNIFVKGTGNTIQNNQISSLDHPGNAILLLSKDNKCIANQTHGDDPVFSRLDEINRKTE